MTELRDTYSRHRKVHAPAAEGSPGAQAAQAAGLVDNPAPQRQLTRGEKRVGVSFNPSRDQAVDNIKKAVAEQIDYCLNNADDATDGEVKRVWNQAATAFEDAAVYAVKAITKPKA